MSARTAAKAPASVAGVVEGRRVLVCAGAGGVGKTTIAAAIGAGMAARGARVAVVTIDPARRLATALGIPELGNEERKVDPELLEDAGIEVGDSGGELWAMMLDAKRTFDELVRRRAPDARTRDAVLSNRIYQELSAAVAGSQEYMAMEKLYELHEEGRYDLIVLDTPPSRNALDFLDAPERLARFIDSRSLRFFLAPGRRSLKILGRGTGLLFSVLKRVTGIDLLRDLSEFFQSFGDMAEGFNERAKRVRELLMSPAATFLLVTSPQDQSIEEVEFFASRLADDGMRFGGAVVNRVRAAGASSTDSGAASKTSGADAVESEMAGALGDDLARRAAHNLADYELLAAHDRDRIARLGRQIGSRALLVIPHLDDDVHDLEGLARLNDHLFGAGGT